MKFLQTSLVITLGIVLIWSAWLHFQNPYDFFSSVQDYALLGRTGSAITATLLPGVMLVVGGSMVFNIWRSSANIIGACLFLIFAVAQASAKFRGMDISCGCFGPNSHEVSFTFVIIWGISSAFLFFVEARGLRSGNGEFLSPDKGTQ